MACTCTEEYRYEGTTKIGFNKVTCQECLDAFELFKKRQHKARKQAELQELEIKNLRKVFDGEDLTTLNAQRHALRQEIQAI